MCALDHPSARLKNHTAHKRCQKIGVRQIDAFTDTPLTGNPAAVILEASGLTDQQMAAIAREMAVPATAFILPPSTATAHVRIRVYTPQAEIALHSHATIASFHALAEEGL